MPGRHYMTSSPALLFFILLALAESGSGQSKWLEDASAATIPHSKVTGLINGKAFTAKTGSVSKSGYINFGTPEFSYDHYTLKLQDGNSGFDSKFSVSLTLTVRKGERIDGKSFRRLAKDALDDQQPGPGHGTVRVNEMYSLSMQSRNARDLFESISDSPSLLFSGRAAFGESRNGKITASLYVCFHDKLKSCVAGTAEVSIE